MEWKFTEEYVHEYFIRLFIKKLHANILSCEYVVPFFMFIEDLYPVIVDPNGAFFCPLTLFLSVGSSLCGYQTI